MSASPEKYYLLSVRGYGQCLVPAEGFWDLFEKAPTAHKFSPGTVCLRADYQWHSMSGGFDTYLQECAIDHARSGYHANGEWKEPKLLMGTFFLREG